MNISIISAIGENNEIGKNNKLLWYLSNDLKRFKELTKGKVIIMGDNTYKSLPFKPLPKRVNIVINNDLDINYNNCIMARSIEESIKLSEYWSDGNEIFVIGGASIYKQFIDKVNKLYITKVHSSFDADTFFPEITDEWVITKEESYKKDEKNEYDYTYLTYEKIKE
jgi:dihydrofolate reductase